MRHSLKKYEHWRAVLDRFAGYDGSLAGFCKENGINVSTFQYWQRALGEGIPGRAGALELVEMRLPSAGDGRPQGEPPHADSGVRLVVGGLRLELSTRFDGDTLARVLDIVEGRPC